MHRSESDCGVSTAKSESDTTKSLSHSSSLSILGGAEDFCSHASTATSPTLDVSTTSPATTGQPSTAGSCQHPASAPTAPTQQSNHSASEISARERLRAGLLQRRALSVGAPGKAGGAVAEKRNGATYEEVVAPIIKRQRIAVTESAAVALTVTPQETESPSNVDEFATANRAIPRTTSSGGNIVDGVYSIDQDGALGWDLDWSKDCASEMKSEGRDEGDLHNSQGDEDWTQSLYTMLGSEDE